MSKMTVSTIPSNTTVIVQDANNITANIQNGNSLNVTVVPTPRQVVQINRGVQGANGNNKIGGYPVALDGTPQNYDALMFLTGEWTNIPQTEISDGGNF